MAFANFIADVGRRFNLPELGISEALGGKNTYSTVVNGQRVTGQAKTYDEFLRQAQGYQGGNTAQSGSQAPATGRGSAGYSSGSGGSGGGSNARATADTLSFLNDQANQLRALLGRADTALSQGLQRNNDEFDRNVGEATSDRDRKNIEQNQGKLSAYERINRNAGTGYRSLAQIIGRAAGTGSSAFRELLPDVIGKDTSSKRQQTTETFGQNLSKIEAGFQGVLADLRRQQREKEEQIRAGIEERKQGVLGQLSENAGRQAEARGGGYAAVRAAQAPLQQQIEGSRNAVEALFGQFRTPYSRQELNPQLAEFTTDRSQINARNQGATDPSNPYAELLRKRQQEEALV